MLTIVGKNFYTQFISNYLHIWICPNCSCN